MLRSEQIKKLYGIVSDAKIANQYSVANAATAVLLMDLASWGTLSSVYPSIWTGDNDGLGKADDTVYDVIYVETDVDGETLSTGIPLPMVATLIAVFCVKRAIARGDVGYWERSKKPRSTVELSADEVAALWARLFEICSPQQVIQVAEYILNDATEIEAVCAVTNN